MMGIVLIFFSIISGNDEVFVERESLSINEYTQRFDSLNVKFVGNWPFGPSRVVACDPGRDLVFCGSGGGVYVIDISAPTLPIQVSEEIHTRNFAYDLQYDQNTQRLYIADGWDSRNEIWDLTDPSNPIRLGSWDTQYFAWRITVDDTFAYVADKRIGVKSQHSTFTASLFVI